VFVCSFSLLQPLSDHLGNIVAVIAYTTMANATAEIPGPLITWVSLLSSTVDSVQNAFHRLPGSPILVRYIKSSYQVRMRGDDHLP
jgi:hypothetical protein